MSKPGTIGRIIYIRRYNWTDIAPGQTNHAPKHPMAHMIQADAYFFDIDGTLLVTRDLVHWNALHQAMLEVYDMDTTIEGLPYHGKTDVAILRAALARCGVTKTLFEERLPKALAVVCREVALQATGIIAEICPGIPELLNHLRERGKFLGVASGNLESG